MKKTSRENILTIIKYVGLGLLFLAWILFLFLNSRKNHQKAALPELNTLESQDTQLQTWSQGKISPQLDDFLTWEITPNENIETLGTIKEKIAVLEQLTQQSRNPKNLNLLIDAYLLDTQFYKARKFYYSLPQTLQKTIPAIKEFQILLNSFSQGSETEYSHLKNLLSDLSQKGEISAQELVYYQSAFALAEANYPLAKQYLEQLTDPKYQSYKSDIDSAFQQYQSLKSVPSYYQEGLIGFQLMKNGFYALAKKVAIPLANEYPNYILPYQILAKTDFSNGKPDSAVGYFQKLLELDYEQKNNYLYHLGVLYYQLGNYAQAVLSFSQITNQDIMLDAERYLVLSYTALGETEKAIKSWQRLAGYPEIKKSDFYSFFQEAFWKPYRKGQSSPYLKNTSLMNAYLQLCPKKLAQSDQVVCQYGQLGKQLATQKNQISIWQITHLLKDYPDSGFYLLLGDLLLENKQKTSAIEAYMKGLTLTQDTQEKDVLKKRILRANKNS